MRFAAILSILLTLQATTYANFETTALEDLLNKVNNDLPYEIQNTILAHTLDKPRKKIAEYLEYNDVNCPFILSGHTKAIHSVAVSPDGRTLLSAGEDKTIRLWDLTKKTRKHTLLGHQSWVRSVVFSPTGEVFASGSADNTIKIWDTCTLECKHILKGHYNDISVLSFSSDGKRLASGSLDHTVRIWDTETGKCLHTLTEHSSSIWGVCFDPNGGETLYSCGYTCSVKAWDSHRGICKQTLRGNRKSMTMAISPDGQSLAVGLYGGLISLIDCKSLRSTHSLKRCGNGVETLTFSPDGKNLYAGSVDHVLRVWKLKGKDAYKCIRTMKGHSQGVWGTAITSDGDLFISASKDKTIRLWETKKKILSQITEDRLTSGQMLLLYILSVNPGVNLSEIEDYLKAKYPTTPEILNLKNNFYELSHTLQGIVKKCFDVHIDVTKIGEDNCIIQ